MKDLDFAWHAHAVNPVFKNLSSRPNGLSDAEAAARLLQYGPNRIERARGDGVLTLLLRQLANPLVYVLLAAALLAVLMGKVTDGFVILAISDADSGVNANSPGTGST